MRRNGRYDIMKIQHTVETTAIAFIPLFLPGNAVPAGRSRCAFQTKKKDGKVGDN